MLPISFGKRNKKKLPARVLAAFVSFGMFFSLLSMPVLADDLTDARNARMSEVVQTNTVEDWPQGPALGAEGAILMEAKTGAILYAKNIDERLYPASTTKIMTGLLAYENAKLDEDVEFSYEAVHDVARGDSNIGMDAGEIIPMNKALEGMMILSANEVANGIAEHVGGGSRAAFVDMMNEKAAEIGCTNTHFTNPNGLHDEQHYTTCRDLATIARYYFGYEYLAALSREPSCEFEATPTQKDSFKLNTKNMLVKGRKYEYEYLVGSKTGFTSEARQTLVSAAKKDGMELICVIMKEETPYQFEDTVALFNYGFENFKRVNIADHQDENNVFSGGFFSVGQDVFGSNKSILDIDPNAFVVLPKNAEFTDVEYHLSYNEAAGDGQVARVDYFFHGNPVGVANLKMNAENASLFEQFAGEVTSEEASQTDTSEAEVSSETMTGEAASEGTSENLPTTNRNKNGIFVNVKIVLIVLGSVVGLSVIFIIVRSVIKEFQFSKKRREVMGRHRKHKSRGRDDDYIE